MPSPNKVKEIVRDYLNGADGDVGAATATKTYASTGLAVTNQLVSKLTVTDTLKVSYVDPATRTWARADFYGRVYKSASIKAALSKGNAPSAQTDFVLSGSGSCSTNASSNGGIVMQGSSPATKFCFLKPRLGARFNKIKWNTSKQPRFRFVIQTGTIARSRVLIGLYSAALPRELYGSTGSNKVEVFMRNSQNTSASAYWTVRTRRGTGASSTATTTVKVASNTIYDIEIRVDALRIPTVWINGALVYTGTALAASTPMVPVVGLRSHGTRRLLTVYHILGSQNIV